MKRSRKALSLLLTLALLLALLPVGMTNARAVTIYVPGSVDGDDDGNDTGAYDYTDVSEDDYYYDAVDWALVNGITNGTSETTFSPKAGCTRAEVMTFLHRAAGEPDVRSASNPFTDVLPGSWYYKAVLWAVEQGITNGTSPTTFSPDAKCTEEQILTFLYRAKGEPSASQSYKGGNSGSWSSAATAWAQSTGMVSTTNTNSLSTTVCTRGNTVYYMYESTVSYTDGTGTFESYTQVSLNGGVYTATTTSSFVSAIMTLVSSYDGKVTTAGADTNYASGRLIVSSAQALPNLAAYHAAQVVTDTNGCSIVQFTSAADAEACARYLDSLSYVNYAEPDVLIQKAAYGSNDTICWGSDATGCAAYAADLVSRGVDTDIIVAVVDSGVDTSHPFLQGRTVAGYDFIGGDAIPDDKDGHGTHVAGTIVDCTPGTNVKIMPVCVLGANGGYTTTIAQGIRYAADHGAKVINLSLGGDHSSYTDNAVNYALSKGVTVVAAAGNNSYDASYFCPAHIGGAITVSAVDSSYRLASFSNYGSVIDLAAPGVNITSSIPGGGYASYQGTSMASPHVAAAAALVLCGQSRSLLPSTVEKRLKSAAYGLGNSAWYGAGFLDMTPFINGTVSDTPDEPTPAPTPTPTPAPTPAPTPPVSGNACGPSLTWSYANSVLTISGMGEMYDYASGSQTPWAAYRGDIRVIQFPGVVSIGAHAFEGCGVTSLTFTGVVNRIGTGAFQNCTALASLSISGIVNSIEANAFAGCSSLRSVSVSGIVNSVDPTAFPSGMWHSSSSADAEELCASHTIL